MNIPRLSLSDGELAAGVSIIKQYSVRQTYPLHDHDFAELFFVSQGQGLHVVNGQHQLLEKGTLVLLRPEDAHSFSAVNYFDFVMYSLGFPVEELQRALCYLDISLPQQPLPPHTVLRGSALLAAQQQLERLLAASPARRHPLFRAMLPPLLHEMLSPADASPESVPVIPPWLAALEEAMRQQENYIAGLPRMLELCPYSQEYLNRMFRLHLKTTPTAYINVRRMVYATELLMAGQHSVTDVCFMAGFGNLSHFYSLFRRLYGCSPKEYRRIAPESDRNPD